MTVQNTQTGYSRKGTINAEGEYTIPSLPIGEYKITVSSQGFQKYTQTGITLQVGENARVNVHLQVGATTQSITVNAQAISVDTETSTVGEVIDNRRIASIPLNTRNVLDLVELLPGVGDKGNLPPVITFSRGGPTFTVSGGQENSNSVDLDGTQLVGAMGNVAQNLPSPDALQEFQMLTNTYDAEYGRASGGVILAVTKSGTNQFHGGTWEFVRNTILDARNYFNPASAGPKPYLRQNQFGGSAGGPVLLPHYDGKNRTFFFVSYQGLRISQQSDTVFTPPTANELAGNFAGQAPIIDPTTGLQFPGNIIPNNELDPLAVNMAKKYLPVNPTTNGTVQQLVTEPITSNQVIVKIDQELSNKDHVSFRFYRDNDVQSGINFGSANLLAQGSEGTRLISYAVNETHIFNPNMLNEANYSYTQPDSTFTASPNNETAIALGGNFGQQGKVPLAPTAFVNGFFSIYPLFPLTEPDEFNQVSDNFSWIKGRHSLKFGGVYLHIHHFSTSQFEGSGFFTFDGSYTGNAMADYLIGRATNLSQQSSLDDNSVSPEYQFYAQDNYNVTPRLTLNLGLRYELDIPYVQLQNQTATIRPYVGCTISTCQQSTVFPTAPPGLVYPGDKGVPRGLVPADKTDYQPRIGFAFDPTGHGTTSIRGAYGIFLDYTGAIISATVNQTLPYVVPFSLPNPPSFSNPYFGRVDPFPYTVNMSNPTFIYPTQQYSVASDYKNGYVEAYDLNIQHQFGTNVIVTVGYYGKSAHRLSDDHEANPAVYQPGATIANVQSRRAFFPQYYSSIGLITSDSKSNYNSLQVSANKRFSHGYTLGLAYTWSKSLDTRSAFSVDAVSGADPFNYLNGEYGLSDFDQRNILAINGVWDLPFLRHRGWLSTGLGGWELAGNTKYGSGTPFNAISGQDFTLEGTGRGTAPERPNQSGNPRLSSSRSHAAKVAEFFNTSVFSAPAPGQYGNERRNIIIGPPYVDTDLSLLKNFKFPKPEWGGFQFRLETFNTFNNVSFNTPNTTFPSPTFGQIESAQPARIIQLGLRYDF